MLIFYFCPPLAHCALLYACTNHRRWFLWTAAWLQLHVSLVHASARSFAAVVGGTILVGPCFSSSDCFFFGWAAFFPSASWPLSFLSLFFTFFLFLRSCLIHARMPDWGRAFAWSGPMRFVVILLHGTEFLSTLTGVLFVSFVGP